MHFACAQTGRTSKAHPRPMRNVGGARTRVEPRGKCLLPIPGKEKGPAVSCRASERVKLLVLVLRNQWPCSRCVRSPDLEADARPHVYAARALWGVGPDEAVGHPNLQINRSEVIADQTTSRRRLITAAEAHGRSRVAAAGVGGRLSFEIANRADRPLADLVDRRQIAVESVTAGDRVIGGAAISR